MCRWNLSPAILLLFPADWDCKSSPQWLLHEVNWHMVLAAPSLTDIGLGRPHGSRAPETLIGGKKKRQKGKGAEVLVLYGLYPEQNPNSKWMGGMQPKELCQVRRALHSPFPSPTFSWLSLRNTWSHLPPWATALLKGTGRALIWGKNRVCLPWLWWVVFQNWVSRDRNIWELGIPKHPCGPGGLYSAISTSCQRKDRKSAEKLKITFRLSHKISIKIKNLNLVFTD